MIVQAQQNDTLDLICWRYLDSTAGVTEQVLILNPHIQSKSPVLPMGTQVRLPVQHTAVKRTLNLWD